MCVCVCCDVMSMDWERKEKKKKGNLWFVWMMKEMDLGKRERESECDERCGREDGLVENKWG